MLIGTSSSDTGTKAGSTMNRISQFWFDKVIGFEGSTRSVALMRILLAILLWTRWAAEVLPWRSMDPKRLALSAAFFTFTTMMFYGWFTRIAMFGSAITMLFIYYYFGFIEGVEPWTHHHTYLLVISTCLLALTPCGKSYSVDRYLAVRRAERSHTPVPAEHGALWGMRLIAIQVSALYLWTAYDKSFGGFLSGERLEQIFMYLFFGSDYPSLWGFHWFCLCAAWLTVLLEYTLPFALWFKSMQRWAVPVGLALHALFYVMTSVGTYSLTMWMLYLAFLDPNSVHRLINKLQGITTEKQEAS